MKKYSSRIDEATDEKMTLNVQISNLKPHHAEMFKQFLFGMHAAGSMGCSRTFKCFVDGDGSFRPNVVIDEVKAKDFEDLKVDFEKDEIGFSFE